MANPIKLMKLKPTAYQFIQEVPIAAPPAKVWRALLNTRVWFDFAGTSHNTMPPMHLEPEVGGRLMTRAKDGSLETLHGIVTHIERGKLLRINGSMGMSHVPVQTVMIFELQPAAGGKRTVLRFGQRTFGYLAPGTKEGYQDGWKALWPKLKALAEGRKRA